MNVIGWAIRERVLEQLRFCSEHNFFGFGFVIYIYFASVYWRVRVTDKKKSGFSFFNITTACHSQFIKQLPMFPAGGSLAQPETNKKVIYIPDGCGAQTKAVNDENGEMVDSSKMMCYSALRIHTQFLLFKLRKYVYSFCLVNKFAIIYPNICLQKNICEYPLRHAFMHAYAPSWYVIVSTIFYCSKIEWILSQRHSNKWKSYPSSHPTMPAKTCSTSTIHVKTKSHVEQMIMLFVRLLKNKSLHQPYRSEMTQWERTSNDKWLCVKLNSIHKFSSSRGVFGNRLECGLNECLVSLVRHRCPTERWSVAKIDNTKIHSMFVTTALYGRYFSAIVEPQHERQVSKTFGYILCHF